MAFGAVTIIDYIIVEIVDAAAFGVSVLGWVLLLLLGMIISKLALAIVVVLLLLVLAPSLLHGDLLLQELRVLDFHLLQLGQC